MYIGSPMFSNSNALNSYTFDVINNCNIIVVYCLNAYRLFPSFKNVLSRDGYRQKNCIAIYHATGPA